MTATEGTALALLESGYDRVQRFLSIVPMTVVFQATVDAVSTLDPLSDPVNSGGFAAFTYTDETGAAGYSEWGMTILVGTTPGGEDVGRLWLVSANEDTHRVEVGWTSFGKVNLQAGHFITVVDHYEPQLAAMRMVPGRDSAGNPTFQEFVFYDQVYVDQNTHIQPIANITASATAPYRPAGWCDAGESYRTVTLYAGLSRGLKGATIALIEWDIADCTLISGTLNSTSITIQCPAGFRHLRLKVTDSNGKSAVRVARNWAHNLFYPPFVNFEVTRDNTKYGRAMDFELFGADDSADALTIPAGAAWCYWEQATFSRAATPAPAAYRDQYEGWSLKDAVQLVRGGKSVYRVQTGGPAAWLDAVFGVPQLLIDTGSAPTTHFEMQGIYADLGIHYMLRNFTTLIQLINIYFSGIERLTETLEFQGGSMLEMIVKAAERYYGVPCFDTFGSLWLRQHFSYRTTDERDATARAMHLSPRHWLADGLEMPLTQREINGQLVGTGAYFNPSAPAEQRSVPLESVWPKGPYSQGKGRSNAPFQDLPSTDPQTELNRLTGHHRAKLENARADVRVALVGNYDVVEPAWQEPITLSTSYGNVRGAVVYGDLFLVREVSIRHNYDRGKPPKEITWTVEAVTSGDAAGTRDIEVPPPPAAYEPPPPPDYRDPRDPFALSAGTGVLGMMGDDGYFYVTRNATAASPTWTRTAVPGLSGTPTDFVPAAFSPLYLQTGTAVNGWVATTDEIGGVEDVFDTLDYTVQKTFADVAALRLIETERSDENFVVAMSVYPSEEVEGYALDIDFTEEDGGFSVAPGYYGQYSSGQGWEATEPDDSIFANVNIRLNVDHLTASYVTLCSNQNVNSAQQVIITRRADDTVLFENTYSNTGTVPRCSGWTANITDEDVTINLVLFTSGNSWDSDAFITSLQIVGYIVGPNLTATHTTDGESWATETVVGIVDEDSSPGLAVSGKASGKAFSSLNNALIRTTNEAASWSALPGGTYLGAAVSVHIPYANNPNDALVIRGSSAGIYKYYNGSVTDISPEAGAVPASSRAIDTCAINRQRLVIATANGVYFSRDGGGTYAFVALPGVTCVRCAGDNENTVYLLGNDVVALTTDFGRTIQDKTGNLLTEFGGSRRFLNICGGGN